MRINVFFVLIFFFLLIAPTSATPHDDAKSTAQGLINDLSGKLPYTAELSESQIENFGYIPDNKGTYKITIKSASYDATAGEAILYINAERDGQSIKVNNPVHFYLPFTGGLSGTTGTKRLQSAAVIIIRYLDAMPLGQPVNDDTSVIYAVNDTALSQTSSSDTWQNLRDGAGSAVSANQAAPYANRLIAHASTADRYTALGIIGVTIPTDSLSGKTVTSGTIKITVYSKLVTLGGSNETAIIAGSPADPRAYVADDYDEWDHTSPTEFANRVDYTTLVVGNNMNFTLNAAGISYLNTAGDTVFYLVDGDVADNTFSGTWAAGASRYVRTKGVADATESNRPFGVFVWTAGGDTTPPSSLTGMANTTNCSQTNITWTNPPDSDFNHTYTMWQNTFDGNLSNTTTFRLKTPLAENTLYTFSTRTCDLTGNCNTTWVNHSVTTGFCGVAPVAAFSANNLTVCQGNPTTFTDASTNNPLTWLWDFDDGNTSALQNPQHVYDVLGLMTVNLTANNTYGSDYERTVDYINVTACLVPTPTPTTPIPTPTPMAGCLYTNITTTIDENNTEWQAHEGNYTWGTLIVNRTQGNISWYSCYATPTPTPAPTWQPQINPPSPDSIFGTIKNWLKEWLKDVFT